MQVIKRVSDVVWVFFSFQKKKERYSSRQKLNVRTKNDFDYPVLRDFPDDMVLTVYNEYAMLTEEWWDICAKCLPENYIKDNWIMLEIIPT